MMVVPEWGKEKVFSARWHLKNFLSKLHRKAITRSDHIIQKLSFLLELFDAALWNGNIVNVHHWLEKSPVFRIYFTGNDTPTTNEGCWIDLGQNNLITISEW